jgi:2-polyprenyl-3-methyl-5-hydroxy-6-metoxy-1,4-benzoquinol methylase
MISTSETLTCWVCGGEQWKLFKPSTLGSKVSSEDFRITDSHYGHTGRIEQCQSCGFKQCVDLNSVLSFYQDLEDPAYDEGREQRGLQARKILEAVNAFARGKRLLDVGAASGILLEQAAKIGFDGVGVEPSRQLARAAVERSLKVHLGTFPHAEIVGPYDVITLVDVIEHVPNPVKLLKDIADHLAPDGVGVLTTPDVEALSARILGSRWWHFRVAHIGYFSKETTTKALSAAGLEVLKIQRPAWFFTWEYAADRAMSYLPRALRFRLPTFARNWTVRVNFRDSLEVIFRKKRDNVVPR